MDASKLSPIPRPGALAAPRTHVIAEKNVVAIRRVPAAKPQVPRPTSSPPPAPHKLNADDVIEFFWKLSPLERAALLARMQRADSATTEVTATPAAEAPRQTLNSADLELLASEPATPQSIPPPLPAAAAKRETPLPTATVPTATATAMVSAPVDVAIAEPSVVVEASVAPPAPVAEAIAPPPAVFVAPVALVAVPPPTVVLEAPTPPRASLPEVTDILFDAMHDLSFFETAVEGGSYCLATALRVIPCLAGLVHLMDVDAREFAVVYTQGPRAERLLLSRYADSDALLARAARAGGPVVVNYGGAGGDAPIERHAFFGDPWSALVVPVFHGGRVLAAIELIDPLDGAPFGEIAENALRYIAERYGEFIAARGIELKNVVALPSETLRT